eukprot:760801-Amorphochlora_amoeboformis.AAC.1
MQTRTEHTVTIRRDGSVGCSRQPAVTVVQVKASRAGNGRFVETLHSKAKAAEKPWTPNTSPFSFKFPMAPLQGSLSRLLLLETSDSQRTFP